MHYATIAHHLREWVFRNVDVSKIFVHWCLFHRCHRMHSNTDRQINGHITVRIDYQMHINDCHVQ